MKIVFLTSCLEPGKDGVGDYTRLLATECRRQGHSCSMAALNDRFVSSEKSESQSGMETVRFGSNLSWKDRIAKTKKITSRIAPDWFSLQFVCYGFHPKGINPPLARWLKTLIGNTPLQIMLHELWIGSEVGAGIKNKIIGAIQKYFVLDLVNILSPKIVHTSNPVYLHLLKQNKIRSERLPLFGNIPVLSERGNKWIFSELQKGGAAISEKNRSDYWLIGFFGTLHPIWPPEPLFSYLWDAAQRHGKKIILLAIGRLGAGQELWNSFSLKYKNQFQFCNLGEQPPEKISKYLNTIDFGIATTPLAIIGKSATVTAMMEHGLPVIVNRDELQFREYRPPESISPLLLKMDAQLPVKLVTIHRTTPDSIRVSVAHRFLESLKAVS